MGKTELDKEKILKLKNAECYIVPESDYGRCEIWRINDMYFLFEIPVYGGEPKFHYFYRTSEIDEMIKTYTSWN